MTIIVTGCQRSGTTIASLILANSKQYILVEDDKWQPSQEGVFKLKSLMDSGRDKFIIQSPTALYNFHFIYHLIPDIHWVGVKRDKNKIIQSMKRVKWMQEAYPDYISFYNHHIRYMNHLWGLLKQLLPKDNWTEVQYPQELQDYPEFIPDNLRSDFTVKQTQLDTPKGPRYWTYDQPTELSFLS
tara:strand:+ start:235 stop:789 length:555 start_codon:yes stop_codon:yes gene_type:complete